MNAVRTYYAELARDLVEADPTLVGVYLHGSAVLGDWREGVSDVDVLVIAAGRSEDAAATNVAAVLTDGRDCPGVELEVSVVAASDAAAPAAPWPYVLHVTTGPGDRKTIWGSTRAGDPDLILHYVVTRAAGWTVYGMDAKRAVGPVPEHLVLEQMVAELRWAVTEASESYAVLNACRALRYRAERVVCSKSDAGHWAVARGIDPTLVERALAAREHGVSETSSADAAVFVSGVAEELARV